MTRTDVSLDEEAYELLKGRKRDGESFSDVVIRLTGSADTEKRIEELAGGLGETFATEIEESSEEMRGSLEMESGK